MEPRGLKRRAPNAVSECPMEKGLPAKDEEFRNPLLEAPETENEANPGLDSSSS